jgi:triacylglycerol esterase/lipase EstA (alpha/beta hydrolase family)
MEQPLDGVVHVYSPEPRLVAFESGPPTSDALVFIGGLGDGLAALPVLPQLHEALAKAHWSLVQPLLSSSYSQWGLSSIDSDATEINRLCEYLAEQGKKRLVLLGHSTGTLPPRQLVRFFLPDANLKFI